MLCNAMGVDVYELVRVSVATVYGPTLLALQRSEEGPFSRKKALCNTGMDANKPLIPSNMHTLRIMRYLSTLTLY